MGAWIMLRALPFVLKHWAAFVLAGFVLMALGWWSRHVHNDNQREIALANAQAALVVERAEKAAILSQLANADNAAKVAIAAKVEAEKAAQKRLQAREREWRRIYGSKPENRAWADSKVPADVLRALQ